MLSFLITAVLLVLGFGFLICGADFLVRGASSIAKKAGLSPLFIGLTIVAFGTSLPEMTVNIFASLRGSNDIVMGNIIGSNIFNLLFILGVATLIFPLVVKKGTVSKEVPLSLLAVVILWVLANDTFFNGALESVLGRADGIVLISFFVIFMYYTFGISVDKEESTAESPKIYSYSISLLMIAGGFVGLIAGGNMLVDAAVTIARFFGVSEALIGLTIVAVGTSLPELATSAVAAFRKNSDIAVGNVVGSNIFNIFWILGISSLIRPTVFSPMLNFDILVLIVGTILFLPFMFIGKRYILQRWQGGTMIGLYVAYVVYLIIRG